MSRLGVVVCLGVLVASGCGEDDDDGGAPVAVAEDAGGDSGGGDDGGGGDDVSGDVEDVSEADDVRDDASGGDVAMDVDNTPPEPFGWVCDAITVGGDLAPDAARKFALESACFPENPLQDDLGELCPTAVITEATFDVADGHLTSSASHYAWRVTATSYANVWFPQECASLLGGECVALGNFLNSLVGGISDVDSGSVSCVDARQEGACDCALALTAVTRQAGIIAYDEPGLFTQGYHHFPARENDNTEPLSRSIAYGYDGTTLDVVAANTEVSIGFQSSWTNTGEDATQCEHYCGLFLYVCNARLSGADQFEDEAACLSACAAWPEDATGADPVTAGDSRQCRLHYAEAAATPFDAEGSPTPLTAGLHCGAASPGGDGVCVD